VGYPESWQDYSGYEVKPDDIAGNIRRGLLFDYHYNVGLIGKPVNRKQWSMTPQTVNAVNLPLQNALNFPAAILQPPFFDPAAPDAVNYGAIGAVMGHEISHTFDTEGSAFDSDGRMRDWWTPSDFAHFRASTAKLAAQYDTYRPISPAFPQPTMATDLRSKVRAPRQFMDLPETSNSSSPSGRPGQASHGLRLCASRF
jgi:putative endopeptidase